MEEVWSLSSVQSHSHVQLFATPWTAAHQASLFLTISQTLLKCLSIESVMPSNHFILCRPFSSCPQSFPTSESFPISQFFESGGQSTGASASVSVLPMNIQDWFSLGLAGLISFQSKWFSSKFLYKELLSKFPLDNKKNFFSSFVPAYFFERERVYIYLFEFQSNRLNILLGLRVGWAEALGSQVL